MVLFNTNYLGSHCAFKVTDYFEGKLYFNEDKCDI